MKTTIDQTKMKLKLYLKVPIFALCVQMFLLVGGNAQDPDFDYFKKWRTVVNNNDLIPGTEKNFNSYNQPSINSHGLLVIRARSKGPDTVTGIWTRNMLTDDGELVKVADRKTQVPWPNNTLYAPDNSLAAFNEFPSIPRIALNTPTMATRGNSQPTWTYVLPDLTESKAGTTGIFTNPKGTLITGASLLGAVPAPAAPVVGTNYFTYFEVPGAVAGTKFDVFPGSPAVTDENIIAFKGNYTEATIGKTGVFYRDVLATGGTDPVKLIANTSTVIPNLPPMIEGITFGSTAPPSAANGVVVFVGSDNEDNPTYGGIYSAPLSPSPTLKTLVGIGSPVPNVPGETFRKFGEALSFDGRYVAFWATWGLKTKHLVLQCPADGNADLIAYCEATYPDGYAVDIPLNQGIFVTDTTTGETTMVAQTGTDIDDFLYWTFSGKPPGVGGGDEGDGELPRWRSSAFAAVSSSHLSGVETVFKARKGAIVNNQYDAPVDAIYWSAGTDLTKLVDTTTDGQLIDPEAPVGSIVSALSIERESFRGDWLAITVSMLEPVSGESMAGVYVSGVRAMDSPTGGGEAQSKGCFEMAEYSAKTESDPKTAYFLYHHYMACGWFSYYSSQGDAASAEYNYHYHTGIAAWVWFHYRGNENIASYEYYNEMAIGLYNFYHLTGDEARAAFSYYSNLAVANYFWYVANGDEARAAFSYHSNLAVANYYWYVANGDESAANQTYYYHMGLAYYCWYYYLGEMEYAEVIYQYYAELWD
jgi:hypothetical protein